MKYYCGLRHTIKSFRNYIVALGVLTAWMMMTGCFQRASGLVFHWNHPINARRVVRHDAVVLRMFSNEESSRKNDAVISSHTVNWYPGHIGKAERQLRETIKVVDVVLEVRDGRLPFATKHPKTPTWCAGKPRVVVVTHSDAVPKLSIRQWKPVLQVDNNITTITDKQILNQARQTIQNVNRHKSDKPSEKNATMLPVVYVNAQTGTGVRNLVRTIQKTGQYIHERRKKKGLLLRPLRVGVLGFPNSGKSSLINKILKRRRAKTADVPGVTRSFQWIRVRSDSLQKGKDFELLDAPGIIPGNLENQKDALLLAACNCISENAYDNQIVASYLCDVLLDLHAHHRNATCPEWRKKCLTRYQVDPEDCEDGDDLLYAISDSVCRGIVEDASRKVLQDLRAGRMGPICLQVAPERTDTKIEEEEEKEDELDDEEYWTEQELERLEQSAQLALQEMQQQGLELPQQVNNEASESIAPNEIGKGQFEGW